MMGNSGNTMVFNGTSTNFFGFVLWGYKDPVTTNEWTDLSVAAVDMSFGLVTNYTGTVNFYSHDGSAILPESGTASYSFLTADNGKHTFTNELMFQAVGEHWLRAEDSFYTNKSGTEWNITVRGTGGNTNLTHFVIEGDHNVWTNEAHDFGVEARDDNEDRVEFVGNVDFLCSDPLAVYTSSYTFVAGDHGWRRFDLPGEQLIFKTPGTQWFEVQWDADTNVNGRLEPVEVMADQGQGFLIVRALPAAVAGSWVDLVVEAHLANGQIDSNYNGEVHFMVSGDPLADLPLDYTFNPVSDEGVHPFPAQVRFNTPGEQCLEVYDTSEPGLDGEAIIQVYAGGATSTLRFDVLMQPRAMPMGDTNDVCVIALDDAGRVNTNHAGNVTFSSSDIGVSFVQTTFGGFNNGMGFISNQVIFSTAGRQTVTAALQSDTNVCGISDTLPVVYGWTRYYVNCHGGSDANSGTTPSDALASISTALVYATQGDIVVVAPGHYAEALTITDNSAPGDTLTIMGDARPFYGVDGGIVTLDPGSQHGITMNGKYDVVISGIEIMQKVPSADAIHAQAGARLWVTACQIEGFARGIYLDGVQGTWLRYSEIELCQSNAFYVLSASDNVEIKRNDFLGNGQGIYVGTSTNTQIIGNSIADTMDTAVCIYSGEAIIKDNWIAQNMGHGIKYDVGRGIIANNVIVNNATNGIHCDSGANPFTMIEHNSIANNARGVFLMNTDTVTLRNNIIAYNMVSGIDADIASTNYWTNVYNCVAVNVQNYAGAAAPGIGCITNDPLFVNVTVGAEDLHVQSTTGRKGPYGWTTDGLDSPCIDTGDTNSPFAIEPMPNGGRVNMGAYGNTDEASMSLVTWDLVVTSPYGSPTPSVGTNSYPHLQFKLASMAGSPEADGVYTQYMCTGFAGTGSVVGGSGTNTSFTMMQDSSLTWLWKTQYWAIASTGPNGSAVHSNGWYSKGSVASFQANNSNGYHFVNWTGSLTTNASTFNVNVTKPVNVTANFAINTYTLSNSTTHGTATPSGVTTHNWNTVTNVMVSPAIVAGGAGTQYVCTGWSGSLGSDTGTSVIVTLTNNVTLNWLWKTQYLFSAVAGSNGYVVASNGWHDAGTPDLAAEAFPSNGYHFTGWTGTVTTNTNPYTAPALTQGYSLTAGFTINQYTIMASNGSGGAISPAGAIVVNHGSSTNFTITANTNWHIASVIVDSIPRGVTNGWLFTNVTSNHSITAAFAIDTRTLNISTPYGTATPTGVTTHNWSTVTNVIINPSTVVSGSTRYVCTGWNGTLGSGTGLSKVVTLTNNATLNWTWKTQYLFNATSAGSGYVVASNGWHDRGTVGISAQAFPSNGYSFTGWTGTVTTNLNPYTAPALGQAYSLTAGFAINQYSITASNVANGLISPTGTVLVVHGGSRPYTIAPTSGYHIVNVWINGSPKGPTNAWTFTNVTNGPNNITASFAVNTYTLTVNTPYGAANPSGVTTQNWNFPITATLGGSPSPAGTYTQYVCIGRTGIGSATSGAGTNFSFNITANSQINWNWKTQYWLSASAGANGSVIVSNGWYEKDDMAVVQAVATSGYHFVDWTGGNTANPLNLGMNQAYSFSANFAADLASVQVNLGPAQAISDGAQWRLMTGPDTGWKNSGNTVSNIPVAGQPYTVTFQTIANWTKPVNITGITLTNGVLTTRTRNYLLGAMVFIPSGTFMMCNIGGLGGRSTTVSDFYIDTHEVTVAEYQQFCAANPPRTLPPAPPWTWADTTLPVVNVTWDDANAYAAWAGKRLPTEAEFEYAARGGAPTDLYPWGNSVTTANANYRASAVNMPRVAGSYSGNGYGLYDVSGNVWEWVNDWYSTKITGGAVTDPMGPGSGTYKVIRGGSFAQTETFMRCGSRYQMTPTRYYRDLGFRCAASAGAGGGAAIPTTGDMNANGIPDWWEKWYFGTPSGGSGSFSATADGDADGHNNLQEYLAGTDPTDANSVLEIRDVKTILTGNTIMLSWASVEGKVYRIDRCTSLLTGFEVRASGISATPPANVYIDATGSTTGPIFYRVIVAE